MEQLKTLRPSEDPKAAAFIKTWDSGLATAEAASVEAEELCASLERELAEFNCSRRPAEYFRRARQADFRAQGKNHAVYGD